MQPKRLKELLEIVEKEIRAGINNPGDFRLQKLCIIDDIIRSYRIAQLYDPFAKKAYLDLNATFDCLYDTPIDVLEAHLAALDKRNTQYMRKQLKEHNLEVGNSFIPADLSTFNWN